MTKRLSAVLFLFLSIFLTLTTCTTSEPFQVPSHSYLLSKEERTILNEFFRDLLFENMGAYTLYGTKPISIAFIEQPLTEEERREWESYYDSLSEEEKSKLGAFKPRYDFSANFQKWQEIKNRFPIRHYLFGSFRLNEKTEMLLFVNIETTTKTLLEHYADFHRILGFDFDPLETVFDVQKPDSLFWKKIATTGHALLGILLGYGESNAWFFEWSMQHEKTSGEIGEFVRSMPSKFYAEKRIRNPDPSHFDIPCFRVYSFDANTEHLIQKYKQEQSHIKRLYKNRDEVDVALDWLTR